MTIPTKVKKMADGWYIAIANPEFYGWKEEWSGPFKSAWQAQKAIAGVFDVTVGPGLQP